MTDTTGPEAIPTYDAAPPSKVLCPFCGGHSKLERQLRHGYEGYENDDEAYAYYVRCLSCAGTGGWAKTPGNAVRNWEMRSIQKS